MQKISGISPLLVVLCCSLYSMEKKSPATIIALNNQGPLYRSIKDLERKILLRKFSYLELLDLHMSAQVRAHSQIKKMLDYELKQFTGKYYKEFDLWITKRKKVMRGCDTVNFRKKYLSTLKKRRAWQKQAMI